MSSAPGTDVLPGRRKLGYRGSFCAGKKISSRLKTRPSKDQRRGPPRRRGARRARRPLRPAAGPGKPEGKPPAGHHDARARASAATRFLDQRRESAETRRLCAHRLLPAPLVGKDTRGRMLRAATPPLRRLLQGQICRFSALSRRASRDGVGDGGPGIYCQKKIQPKNWNES